VQSNANAGPGKKACDFLSKADAEAILGQPAELRSNSFFDCWYVETGWTNKPPQNKIVSSSASTGVTVTLLSRLS
jgi:hypothetical protein